MIGQPDHTVKANNALAVQPWNLNFARAGEHGAAFGGGDVDLFGVRHVRPFG